MLEGKEEGQSTVSLAEQQADSVSQPERCGPEQQSKFSFMKPNVALGGSRKLVERDTEVLAKTPRSALHNPVSIPAKPPLFSLAQLAKEHRSSPPSGSAFSRPALPQTRPSEGSRATPPTLSLAQLARQQESSSPKDQALHRNERNAPMPSSLVALAQGFHSADRTTEGQAAPAQDSGVSGAPPGFSLSALASQHEQAVHKREDPNTTKTEKHAGLPPGFKSLPQIDLSALAAQHVVRAKAQQKDAVVAARPVISQVEVSSAKPSVFGRAVCSHYSEGEKLDARPVFARGVNFPKFSFKQQMSRTETGLIIDSYKIVPFDFSTPSPDDVVQEKQKGAFTRTGNKTASTASNQTFSDVI